ncbi:MAG: type II secretion system F family protein [Candidatus Nealsonbacteria bacterium]|nr:type II secretion system F family protein [Candidatus Nealsonbacteria bacterium]
MFNFQKEKMLFAEHLSLLIKGGTTLNEALDILKEESKSRTFKKALDSVSKRILEGESLNKSLARYPKIFNKFFQNVVKVGEESGTLEENLKYLSLCLKNQYSLKQKLLGALMYPIIVIALALVIVSGTMIFILPKLFTTLNVIEAQLPLSTKILFGISVFIQKYWIFLIVIFIFLILIYKIFNYIKITRFYFHKIIFFMPFFGTTNKNSNLAEFSRVFFTLLKSGVPILEAFDICNETVTSDVYKKYLKLVKARVEKGQKLSKSFKAFPKIFPSIFSQMILVGEKSGTLEESMSYLAEFYEQEADSALKNFSAIIEPILLILVGFFVAFIALSIITPIYQITSNLSQ